MLRAFYAALAAYSLLVDAASGQDFVGKSRACVELIRQKSPRTPIRAGLSVRDCPLPDIVTSDFSGTPVHAWLSEGAACLNPLTVPADGQPPPCGEAATSLDAGPHALLRLPLPDGRCLHVLPLMLTDARTGFSCNAVTTRRACVRSVQSRAGKTIVRLASRIGIGGVEREIVVSAGVERHKPLMAHDAGGTLFALLPAQFTALGQERDVPGFLRHAADRAATACTQAPDVCKREIAAQIDRQAQQLLRRVWNPKLLLTREARDAERNAMAQRIAADIGEPQAAEKRALMRIIMANEISDSSPSQVLDAVIQNSGISWGAHQIDIGANGGPEVAMFWDTLREWRRAPGTGDYPLLRRADTYRACLSQPIRAYFTEHLSILYGGVSDMNKGFRSAMAQKRYEAHFRKWLGEEVARLPALTGLFAKSPFARFYYLDVRNQKGATRGEELRRLGEAVPATQLATCAGIEAGEIALVDFVKSKTPKSSEPDIMRRVGNIAQFLEREHGAGQGRDCR